MRGIIFGIISATSMALADQVVTVQQDPAARVSVYELSCATVQSLPANDQAQNMTITILANPLNDVVPLVGTTFQRVFKHWQFHAQGCNLNALQKIKETAITFFDFAPAAAKLTTLTETANNYIKETLELTLSNPDDPSDQIVLSSIARGSLPQ